nr:hypothetical protein [Mycoplasmopsis bovis]
MLNNINKLDKLIQENINTTMIKQKSEIGYDEKGRIKNLLRM